MKKTKAAAPAASAASPAPGPAAASSPAVPPALAGLTKEQVDTLAVDAFLKTDMEPSVGAPAWLRPLAWAAFALCAILGTVALLALQRRYQGRLAPPPPSGQPPQPPTRVL